MGVCFNKQQKPTSTHQSPPEEEQSAPKRRQHIRLSVMPRHRENTHEEEKLGEPKIEKPPEIQVEQEAIEITERLFIHGVMGTRSQKSFEDKAVKSSIESITLESLSSLGIGVSCKKGLKPRSPNQDDFCLLIDPNFRLFCVFDGHGLHGHEISNFVKLTFPDLLIENPLFEENPKQALFEAFKSTNEVLIEYSRTAKFNCEESGTTATVGLLKDKKLFVAHVGDSRGVLGSKKGGKNISFRITTDHKPELPDETTRIKAAGGEIRRLPEDIPYRIFMEHEEGPGLSISRAIGDRIAQTIGVSCEPEIAEIDIEEETEYLVICSDGVWEFVNDSEAVASVAKIGNKCKVASEKLAYMAWNRWIENEESMVDDITAMVVYLPWQINK